MFTSNDKKGIALIVAYLQSNKVDIVRQTSNESSAEFYLKVPGCDGPKRLTVKYEFLREYSLEQIKQYMETGDYVSKMQQNGDQHFVPYQRSF